MNWILIPLHSVLAHLALYFGVAYGLTIPAIFLTSLASSFHLRSILAGRVLKAKQNAILDLSILTRRVDAPVWGAYILFNALPYALVFWILAFGGDTHSAWIKNIIQSNEGIVGMFQNWLSPSKIVSGYVSDKYGIQYLQSVYLIVYLSSIALFLSTILHLILLPLWIQSYCGRISKNPKHETKLAHLRLVIAFPVILVFWLWGFYSEVTSDFFLRVSDGEGIYKRDRMLYAVSLINATYPIMFSYFVAATIRSFGRLKFLFCP